MVTVDEKFRLYVITSSHISHVKFVSYMGITKESLNPRGKLLICFGTNRKFFRLNVKNVM